MKKPKQKSAKTSYDRANLFRQALGVPTYEEGGPAGQRNIRDQVAGPEPKQKNRFLKGLADVGKFSLNSLTTPFETVTGWEFYDPKFSDTKFGNTVGQISNVTEGMIGAGVDLVGTAIAGPAYGAAKSGLTSGFDMLGAQDQTSGQVYARGGAARKYATGGPPLQEKFQAGWQQALDTPSPYDPLNPPWGFSANPGAGVRPGQGFQPTFPAGPSSNPSDAPKQRAPNTLGGMGGIEQQQLLGQDTQNTLSRMYHSNPGNPMQPESIAPLAPMQGGFSDTWSAVNAQKMDNPNPDITSDPASRVRPTSMSKEEEDAMMLNDPSYRRDDGTNTVLGAGSQTGTAGQMYNAPDEPVLPTKGRGARWKDQLKTKNPNSDFMSAFIGTDRTAHSLGNQNQWAGIAPFIQGFKDPTLAETAQQEKYQKNVREGNRKMDVYGQDGVSAGITGDTDPRPKEVYHEPTKYDWSERAGNTIAQLGDLGQKAYSGYAGGEGPEWSKFLGSGEVPKADMGGSIGQFYGGVNAAFLANRDDKKHLGYGYNSGGQPPKKYETGGMTEKKDTVNLEELPGGVLKVPQGFDGALELNGGNLHNEINPQTGKTGVHVITPGEGQEVEIEAQRGEMLDVDKDTQETFVIPRKFTPEYKKVKKEQGRIEGKLEKHAEKKEEGKEKLDDIEVESLKKKLNNSYIRQDAIRQQILEEKEASEIADAEIAMQLGQEGQQPIMGSEAPVENFAEGAGVSAPFTMGMANYGRGIRNTKDWYETVAPGGMFEPINPFEGVMDESVNYLKDGFSQIDAAEATAAERDAMKINNYNKTVQNKVNSAGIEDARMRANSTVQRRDSATRRDTFGKQRLNLKGQLAQMMGKGNQLEAMGADKMRQNEQMLVGDYHGALAKDYDEIYSIMGSESKYQAQNAINKRLQEQLESMKESGVDPAKIPMGKVASTGTGAVANAINNTTTTAPVNKLGPSGSTGAPGQIPTYTSWDTVPRLNSHLDENDPNIIPRIIVDGESLVWNKEEGAWNIEDTQATTTQGGGNNQQGTPGGTQGGTPGSTSSSVQAPTYTSWADVPRLNSQLDEDDPNITPKIIVDGQPMVWNKEEGGWNEEAPETAEEAAIRQEEELNAVKEAYKKKTGKEYVAEEIKPLEGWAEGRTYENDWEKDFSSTGGYYTKDNKYYDDLGTEIGKEAYDNRLYTDIDEDGNELFYDKDKKAVTEEDYYKYLDKYDLYDDTETDEERTIRLDDEIEELEQEQLLLDEEEAALEGTAGVTTQSLPATTVVKDRPTNYQSAYDLAVEAGLKFPAAVASQFGEETGWGKSLSNTKHGLFNIKYTESVAQKIRDKAGIKVYKGSSGATDSQTGSKDYYLDFETPLDAMKGYQAFLETNPRYKTAGVFDAKTDEEYIAAIAKAGYAENKSYEKNLLKILKQHKTT